MSCSMTSLPSFTSPSMALHFGPLDTAAVVIDGMTNLKELLSG
jgi:hypothetical protein